MNSGVTASFWEKRRFHEIKDIGGIGQLEVQRIYRHLCAKQGDMSSPLLDWVETRPAPSLVTRSEAFMLGLSSPRFAIRMRLPDGQGAPFGFFQLRRMSRFASEVSRSDLIRERDADKDQSAHSRLMSIRNWRNKLARASCIADSLLILPSQYTSSDWIVLQVPEEVKASYGCSVVGPCVPFMKHIDLVGGGMCAQACCFMASLLLYDTIQAIHGIADITAWSSKNYLPGQEGQFVMSGLNAEKMALFYERANTGVTVFEQPARMISERANNPAIADMSVDSQQSYRNYVDCVCAYIRSGFPVVLSVDLGRMAGQDASFAPDVSAVDVFTSNGLLGQSALIRKSVPVRMTHAILAIGYRRGPANDVTILCMDPATVPFLEIRGSELYRIGCYSDQDNYLRDTYVPLGSVMLPSIIRRPLLDGGSRGMVISGLRVRGIRAARELMRARTSVFNELPEGDQYHLLKVRGLAGRPRGVPSTTALKLNSLSRKLRRPEYADSWVWVHECVSQGLVIWDAQKDELAPVAVLGPGCADWDVLMTDQNPCMYSVASREKKKPSMRMGLISSFSNDAHQKSIPSWRDNIPCELYTFMRKDAEHWLPGYEHHYYRRIGTGAWRGLVSQIVGNCIVRIRRSARDYRRAVLKEFNIRSAKLLPWPTVPLCVPQMCVRDWLASKEYDSKYIRRVAEKLHKDIYPYHVKVSAFCTFMPGMTNEGAVHANSKGALRFLCKLARELVSISDKYHEIQTIVVSAGSVLSYLGWARHGDIESARPIDAERQVTYAKCISRVRAVDRLLDSLFDVAAAFPGGPKLAIELEPSVLSAVATEAELEALTVKLAAPRAGAVVGINCDTGHWHLAGINPENVSADIRKAIVHAHLCILRKGHLADRVPREGCKEEENIFIDWLDFLRQSEQVGAVIDQASLELELADSPEAVWADVTRARNLFNGDGV